MNFAMDWNFQDNMFFNKKKTTRKKEKDAIPPNVAEIQLDMSLGLFFSL